MPKYVDFFVQIIVELLHVKFEVKFIIFSKRFLIVFFLGSKNVPALR